ncbi:hypothetical protein GPALN_015049 [Globodera pallida]|nr:hypothetical protein GPALN_015049 [Globodera pallida]
MTTTPDRPVITISITTPDGVAWSAVGCSTAREVNQLQQQPTTSDTAVNGAPNGEVNQLQLQQQAITPVGVLNNSLDERLSYFDRAADEMQNIKNNF